jgi:hypothetical protein
MNSMNGFNNEETYFPDINSPYKRMGNTEHGVPVKKLLRNQRISMITSNPQNAMGTAYLRDKFKLPDSNKSKKVGRQIGGPSNIYNTKPTVKTSKPKRILPKWIRDDPLADGPKITEDDLADGMMSLLTRGIIPKGVDVTPAFERGNAPFGFGAAKIYDKRDKNALKYTAAPAIAYQGPAEAQKEKGPTTFITSEGAYDNTYLNETNKSNVHLFPKPDLQDQLEKEQYDTMHQRDIIKPNIITSDNLPPALIEPHDEEQNDYIFNTQDDQVNEGEGLYSMYQIAIKGGKVIENTPEYISFKRSNITKWGAVSLIIYLLERMLSLYHVPNAIVDGSKLVNLAEEELTRPNNEELLECLINRSQVEEQIKNPSKKFKGPSGPDLAAI